MSSDSGSITEDTRPPFRNFTRESLVAIQARISEEYAKKKELEKKRAEGEVRSKACRCDVHVYTTL
jgi:voltage-gated sodium channel type II alpha